MHVDKLVSFCFYTHVTIYLNGHPKQVALKRFDVVFLAGNPDHPDPPRFEHVALVAEPHQISVMGDWMNLAVYGLPESDTDKEGGYLRLGSAESWIHSFVPSDDSKTAPLGHPESCWNLVMRPEIDEFEVDFWLMNLAIFEGGLRYKYDTHFEVRLDNQGIRHTNCLGFVIDVLTRSVDSETITLPSLAKVPPLVKDLPEYTIRYFHPSKRTTPSIGHLACSLDREVRTSPYGSELSSGEAEAKALAKAFIAGKTQIPS